MKRALTVLSVAAALGGLVSGCSEGLRPSAESMPGIDGYGPLFVPLTEEAPCGEPVVVPLVSGRVREVGTVAVANGATLLRVTLQMQEGWLLQKSQVAVVTSPADFPVDRHGNPRLGKFPYRSKYVQPVTTYEYLIPLSDFAPQGSETLYVAVHALVQRGGQRWLRPAAQSAWALERVSGDAARIAKRWAHYFPYALRSCGAPPACSLTLVGPEDGAVLCAGSPCEILWESAAACADFVRIELLHEGVVCETLAESAVNSGSYEWDAAQPCAEAPFGYTLRVSDPASGAACENGEPLWIEDCGTGE
ncbi:MAG: hypothetical protein V1774_04695 [Candidatus Eisenbacteria bacterium]